MDVVTGGVKIGFEQRGLGKFAIKLCNFKLVGLLVVAEELRGFDGFFPVAVLLVDAEQVLTGFARHVAFLQADEDLFGTVNQACALVVLREFEQHPRAFFVDGIGRVEQGLVHIDGFVVFAALTVEFAQGQVEVVRLRLLVDDFRQFAGGTAAVAVNQCIQTFVKAGRHAFRLFQHGFHVNAGGKPAHGEKDGQKGNGQEDDPQFVVHVIPFLRLGRLYGLFGRGRRLRRRLLRYGGGKVFFAQMRVFFDFGTQAVVFAAQRQKSAEQGKHTEHDADDECAEEDDNQR